MISLSKRIGAKMLPKLFPVFVYIFLVLSLVSAKVENSFQSNQYPQYKDYYGSTPGYQYPDLTVESGSTVDTKSSPIVAGGPIQQSQDPLLSQSSAQQPVAHSNPNQHMYYYETYPMQDSFRGNFNGQYNKQRNGGNKRCTYTANGEMRCYSRQDSYGYADYDLTGEEEKEEKGLLGLLGLIGLIGLKPLLKIVLPIIFFPLLLPFLLLLALPLILLLPIPVVSVPAPTGRNLQRGFTEARKLAEKVISSEECIERISCEVSKMSQKRKAGEWIEKALNYLPETSPYTKRIFKGFEMMNNTTTEEVDGKSEQQPTCAVLKCKVLTLFEFQS